MNKVSAFTLHNDRGQSILNSELGAWMSKSGQLEIFGPVIRYTWTINGAEYEIWDRTSCISLHELPDASGFIGFEYYRSKNPNNCFLLDAFGKERMRLTVPWALTNSKNPDSKKSPSHFSRIGDPCINPANGELSKFGVIAWVEHSGLHYLELDYHTGKFLWGREIRD